MATPSLSSFPSELLEMTFKHLPGTEITRLQLVSKQFNAIIKDSPQLQRRLFLAPEKDETVTLLKHSKISKTHPGQAKPHDIQLEADLHRHFGMHSKAIASAPTNSDAAKAHRGHLARPVRYNPWIFSKPGPSWVVQQDTFWRSLGRTDKGDKLRLIRLKLQSDPRPGPRSVQSSRLSYMKRTMHPNRNQLADMLKALTSPSQDEVVCTQNWKVEDKNGSWNNMFLCQPPARRVTVGVLITRPESLSKPKNELIVKDLAIKDGIRLGHIVATLSEEDKSAIRTAMHVETRVFLHGVVEVDAKELGVDEVAEEDRNAIARPTPKSGKRSHLLDDVRS